MTVKGVRDKHVGENLRFGAESGGPGDLVIIPPDVPHRDINASTEEPPHYVLVLSDHQGPW